MSVIFAHIKLADGHVQALRLVDSMDIDRKSFEVQPVCGLGIHSSTSCLEVAIEDASVRARDLLVSALNVVCIGEQTLKIFKSIKTFPPTKEYYSYYAVFGHSPYRGDATDSSLSIGNIRNMVEEIKRNIWRDAVSPGSQLVSTLLII